MDKRKSQKQTDKQVERMSKVIEERKNDFLQELLLDFQTYVIFAISQLTEEELYNARGLKMKYLISGGKLKRDGGCFCQTLSVVMDPIFGDSRTFGNYEDYYSAFREFRRHLQTPKLMVKIDPAPPRFIEEEATVEVFIYFDPEK